MTPAPEAPEWFPIRVDWRAARPAVEWAYLGDARFTAPFFEQTVGECLRHPFNHLFRRRTPIEGLDAWAEAGPELVPAGFIFHMSRCGSTLLAQLLATLPRVVVLSEAEPIDAILRIPGLDDARRVAWLRGMVAALGRRRHAGEERLVIKFDSWNARDLPLIERAFPGVPWVFLVREPVEVLVSQIRQRALYMIPGMLGFGAIDPAAIVAAHNHPEEHCARVLGEICRAAVGPLRGGTGLALNYRQLPAAAWGPVADFFGLRPTGPEVEAMEAASRFNAKSPSLTFEADGAAKDRAATDLIRAMADRHVRPHYAEIEAIRLRRSPEAPAG